MRSSGFRSWLDRLQQFLETQHRRVRITNRTNHSVQFKFDDIIDVDLLVSPCWSDQQEYYDYLRSVRVEDRYERVISNY